jgi:hypothetical protein
MIARATVKQEFINPGRTQQDWAEGIYVFPLPETAAVDHLRMRIGERIIEGQIKERAEAKRIYEEAKQAGIRTSLVEQERANMFTSSLANIGRESTSPSRSSTRRPFGMIGGNSVSGFPRSWGLGISREFPIWWSTDAPMPWDEAGHLTPIAFRTLPASPRPFNIPARVESIRSDWHSISSPALPSAGLSRLPIRFSS